MKEVKTLLLDKELNTRVLGPTHRRMIRNLTLTALKQIYDPGNRTLIARFLLCGSDVEPIIISPAISWSSADLRATDLKGCKLARADLRWANLQRADLRGKDTDLTNSLLIQANLSNADLRAANLRESNLFQAEMNGVLLNGADLSDADLSMADLSQSDLRFTNFVRANLGSTRRPPGPKNQNGAILREVNLEGAFLQRADLRDADLTGANLAGADLRDGKLSGANLSRVTWNAKTQWPDLATMKQARNIPKLLREQLGI